MSKASALHSNRSTQKLGLAGPKTQSLAMKLIFLCVALALLFAGCRPPPRNSGSTVTNETVRTDVAPIVKRLPKLGQLQSVWWTSNEVTIDSPLSPPRKPAYRIVGFAQLESGKADEISREFQWQRTPPDWKPALTITNLSLDSAEWSQSPAFTKDSKPQQIPGKLFFDRLKGVVYFDLEIE
jgi:hypothetical protein